MEAPLFSSVRNWLNARLPTSSAQQPFKQKTSFEAHSMKDDLSFVNALTMDRLLQDKAKDLTPNLPIKPNGIWVAVLHHSKKAENVKEESDFLWLKCNRKITVGTIRAEYGKKNPIDFVMKQRDSFPDDLEQISQLNYYNDNLIVFRALESSSAEALQEPQTRALGSLARPPLQPTNAQLTVPKSRLPAAVLHSPHALLNGPVTRLRSPIAFQNENIPPWTPKGSVQRLPSSTSPMKPQLLAQDQKRESSTAISSEPLRNELGNPGLTSSLHARTEFPDTEATKSEFDDPELSSSQMIGLFNAVPNTKAESSRQESEVIQNVSLEKLSKETSPETLESAVQEGLTILSELRAGLTQGNGNSDDARQWLHQIDNIQKQAGLTRTVVGVVGNTGAGKSSVINAMLEEERLLPTNCMRACTAVVTELSWNESDDPSSKYRAEVEFIRAEDWEKELRVLFEELLDGSGKVSRECANADSEAGVAYAKIKAVYPKKTKDDLANSSVESLIHELARLNVLGTTRMIDESRPEPFYRSLQRYVDSREKTDLNKEKDNAKARNSREMEFWPLIKVVKIFVKAAALSTGAVIVDLPGVHDSNAARAAVADNYMKQCTGLWIVAPINRAVDDKAAKSLLGESFKRQLKFDGTYSSVTFICSKTDDISITEAVDSLDLSAELTESQQVLDENRRGQRHLEQRLAELEESYEIYADVFAEADAQCDVWESLQDELAEGRAVYPPSSSTKRKRSDSAPGQRKRRKETDSDFEQEDEGEDKAGSDDDELAIVEKASAQPLSEKDLKDKLEEFKANKKNARQQKSALKEQIDSVRKELTALKNAAEQVDSKIRGECISGRNAYSKGAIQQDFAAGIKELDQENAAEDAEESFNPEDEVRDYEEVARSLPVFCVSSRAYQKLSGRLLREAPVPGFITSEETEIPQLQAHCRKLTEAGRAASCRRFLNELNQMINSISFWASDQSTAMKFSNTQREAEVEFILAELKQLKRGLEVMTHKSKVEMEDTLRENIFEKCQGAVKAATENANPACARWAAPVNRADRPAGGYYWATYKAVVRRNGLYQNSNGLHDFNAELTEPIYKSLANGWERAFARRLPALFQAFARTVSRLLKEFHRVVEKRSMQHGISLASLSNLRQQNQFYGSNFDNVAGQVIEKINAMQKDVNRELKPVVAAAMENAYQWCAAEMGPGQYLRMKSCMATHIDTYREEMFSNATESLQAQLSEVCRTVEKLLVNQVDEVFVKVRNDYLTVLGGASASDHVAVPKAERSMKEHIRRTLADSEVKFRSLVEVGEALEPNGAEIDERAKTEEVMLDDSAVDQEMKDDADSE